jgi:hypothetical protein
MLFTNALMLAGLSALAIPVIIHLLLKRKKKRLRFSTNQFFLKQDEQSSQKRKLRNWLLLSLRLLIFTLLVLAFARPFLPQSKAAGDARQRRQAIFVLDRSASMHAIGTDGQRWAQAKDRVEKALSELKPDDRAALIGCSSQTEVLSGFAAPAVIGKLLGDLQATYGTSNLGEGVQQAVKLLSLGEPKVISSIYIVSDLQRSACQSLASAPVPDQIEVKLFAVGDLFSPNLAISQLQLESTGSAKPQLTASNFSDEDSPNVTLDLSIDGKAAFSRQINLSTGASTNLEISIPALKPGWHTVKASLQGKDSLEADDGRYSSLFVPEPTQVLVVESRKTKRLFEEESFFISVALDPTKDSTNSLQATYNVVKITPEEIVSKLSGNQTQPPCHLIILPGLKQVPAGSGQALTAYVQAGGGLALFVGDGISANRYNSEFRDLLPAQLGNVETAPDVGSAWRIGEFDTNTTIFAAFRLPHSGDLRIPTFTTRFTLTGAAESSQPALFDDGMPLMVTRPLGRGRVVLVNTTADTAWNDWPKHKTFVPWLHGLGRELAPNAGPHPILGTNNFLAGDDLQIELGATAKKVQFKLQSPKGKEQLLAADDEGRVHDSSSTIPGIYSLLDPNGHEVRRLAVNVPAQESDLAALPPLELQQQLVRVRQSQNPTLAAGLFGSTSNQKELWRVLLLGVLVLLFSEAFVANRTVP